MDTQLLDALSDTAVSAMSNADAAANISTPTAWAPIAARITYATLADAWGTARADQVMTTLEAIAADATNPAKPDAASAVRVLNGTGFDMSSQASKDAIAKFVAAGIATQDEANKATCVPTYKAGGPRTEAEVTAARAILAEYLALKALRSRVEAAGPQVDRLLSQLLSGQTLAVPVWNDLGM